MSILDTGRDLRRLNELTGILLKYGFADMIRLPRSSRPAN